MQLLLIRCRYRERELPELEFAYAGEAHVARPRDPGVLSDSAWADYLFRRSNIRGVHAER